MPCDHAHDDEVVAVFDEIKRRSGRLDIVVNVASPDFAPMIGQPFNGSPWPGPFPGPFGAPPTKPPPGFSEKGKDFND